MDYRDYVSAFPHAILALASVGLAVVQAGRTASGVAVVEIWLPLALAVAILYAGWRFCILDPTRTQVWIVAALLCGGGLYGASFVAFIQFLQIQSGIALVYPYYMSSMAGAGGVAMATIIAHYYVGYTQRMREDRRESDRAKQLQKQASVLNRTLRHNLKNELEIIDGWLDIAFGQTDADPERGHRIVTEHIDKLQETSERARRIDRVLQTDETVTVDIVTCIEDARQAVDETVTVDATLPDTASAVVHPEVETAIEEVFRNTIEHNDTTELAVEASVSLVDQPDDVSLWCVDITDTGNGIPDVELDALDGTSESPLKHGSGLGLYLVQTIVEQSDGYLSIKQSGTDDGTTVRMAFPVDDEAHVDDCHRATAIYDESNRTGTVLTSTDRASLD